MTATWLLLALLATVATGGGGYLLGLLVGQRARRALAANTSTQDQTIQRLQAALDQGETSRTGAQDVRTEMRAMLSGWMGEQQASAQQTQGQIRQLVGRLADSDRSGEHVESLRQEIHRTLAPMLERDREQKGLREVVLDALGPLMEHQRRAQGLRSLSTKSVGREHLPALLDTIASKGGFSSVLVSDEMGLPVAASSRARDTDVAAGVSSLILTLADRVAATGGSTPTAVLVRNKDNQRMLHRIFTVSGERFLIVATTMGEEVASDALDPALTTLENALGLRKSA